MKIPSGVNHLEFYKKAKQQGVSISSRFTGVHMNINGGKPNWMARVQGGGRNLAMKRFPFTEQGEIDAGTYYERRLKTLSTNQ